ncbi:MAG: hypothetical protein QNK30_16320 [Bacteroidales bacterium]|nr:hypothetical protein [Bacteroidales bacterium]
MTLKKDVSLENLYEIIESLEKRLEKLESGVSVNEKTEVIEESYPELPGMNLEVSGSLLESRIGEYGLAWLGNLVLLLGISFLTQYISVLGYPFISAFIGYGFIIAIFSFVGYLRESNTYLAKTFELNGHLLLYYVTLRLHFFSSDPFIANRKLGIALLFLVLIFEGIMAIRRNSQLYAGITLVLILFSAIVIDSTMLSLSLVCIASLAGIIGYAKYDWKKLLILSLPLVYLTFFIWLMNNFVLGHPWGIRSTHEFGHLYLIAIAGIYSIGTLIRQEDPGSENFVTNLILLNGISFTAIMTGMILGYFAEDFLNIAIIISVFCLLFSVILKYYSPWKFSSASYALYGFMAMSLAIYKVYDLPGAYFLLSLQSLLVVSMAIWFRNKLIVIMNFALFTGLFIAYLVSAEHTNLINFSFVFVSLGTARILNWKKQMLEIKTEMIRNFYLFVAFFIVLYALYQGVPKQYVSLSWGVAAIVYFILSVLLKNIKYRYMALGTVISAAIYLFLVDMANLELIYRILAFLVLAIISIAVSIYYSKSIKKSPTEENSE